MIDPPELRLKVQRRRQITTTQIYEKVCDTLPRGATA